MEKQPKIALVGRPNVGKSALFNRILGKRIAIVDEMEGVTRDRLYARGDLFGTIFQLIDTGGIDEKGEIPFYEEIKQQTERAIAEADVLIMVVDARVGLTPVDEEVVVLLRKSKKPLCLAINKMDDFEKEELFTPFYALGIKEMVAVSASHGYQIAELLTKALALVTSPQEREEMEGGIKIAIIGRPNVGKSTLINNLLDENRCIVSPIAGTTRDAIDVTVSFQGKRYTFIDTAGIRRKKGEKEALDKFATIRTEQAIERADLIVFLLDSLQGITKEEKKILGQIEQKGRGCILFFNKWDLTHGIRMEHCITSISREDPFLTYCPILFGSAMTGRGVEALFPHIEQVAESLQQRISTGQLNSFVENAMQKYHPARLQGRRLRIYYVTQVGIRPPRFLFFVNSPALIQESYKKYLLNQLREKHPFTGAPIHLFFRGKTERKEPQETNKNVDEMFKEALEIEHFTELKG